MYQMDLFDLEDVTLRPKANPGTYQELMTFTCPKCGCWVGIYWTDDRVWEHQKEECPNGHKMDWGYENLRRGTKRRDADK